MCGECQRGMWLYLSDGNSGSRECSYSTDLQQCPLFERTGSFFTCVLSCHNLFVQNSECVAACRNFLSSNMVDCVDQCSTEFYYTLNTIRTCAQYNQSFFLQNTPELLLQCKDSTFSFKLRNYCLNCGRFVQLQEDRLYCSEECSGL